MGTFVTNTASGGKLLVNVVRPRGQVDGITLASLRKERISPYNKREVTVVGFRTSFTSKEPVAAGITSSALG